MDQRRLRVLTNSELKTHRRCSLEHHIAYGLGYRPVAENAEALRFGTAIHAALEAWWSWPWPSDNSLAMALARVRVELFEDPYELARAEAMLEGYHLRWQHEPYQAVMSPGQKPAPTDPYQITINPYPLVEAEFRAPLINPATGKPSRTFQLGGKLDGLVKHTETGQVYILEHKTSGEDISPGSLYWQLLQLDTQVSTYYAGARALGFEPAGVIYDVLGKSKLRPHQATPADKKKYTATGKLYANLRAEDETPQEYGQRVRDAMALSPDKYFVRGTVVRLEQEELDAQWDAWQQARLIREADLYERWPRNPDSCKRWGRTCSYFPVCTKVTSLQDLTKFQRVTHVHSELTPMETLPDEPTHPAGSARNTH
jgi:hypothetical protein